MLTRNEEYVLGLVKSAPGKWVNNLDVIGSSELPERQTIFAIIGLTSKGKLLVERKFGFTWLQAIEEG